MPTPVEHYERAEEVLELADKATDPLHAARLVTRAGVHAALASVPWGEDDRGLELVAQGLDAEQVAACLAVVTELGRWAKAPAVLPTTGNGSRYEEGHVDGWEAARDVVGGLVASALEALGE